MKKFLIAALIVLLMGFINIGVIAYDQTVPLPEEPVLYKTDKAEFRGVWISTYTSDVPTYKGEASFKASMNSVFEVMEHFKLNAMVFHIRTHNNALYKSKLNPVASWWKTVNFDEFDPLAWLIDECHKRGIEFHAWMNPYRLGNDHYYGSPLPAANPQNDRNNVLVDILNPGIPTVRSFLVSTVMEVVENYDVDAIHFDDYFYQQLYSSTGSILDEADQETFLMYPGNYNTSSTVDKANWRREQVNLLIEGISMAIKKYNAKNGKHVQFGISPTGIYRNGDGIITYDDEGKPITTGSATNGQEHYASYLYADSLKWISEGWLDYIIPQSYWATDHSVASYYDVMGWWDQVVKYLDVNLYSGIGVYQANEAHRFGWMYDPTELYKQLDFIQQSENIKGACFYSYKHLEKAYKNDRTLFSTQQLANIGTAIWREKRLLPPIKSMAPVVPDQAENFTVRNNVLTWTRAENAKFYIIYRDTEEVIFTDRQIIAVVGGNDDVLEYRDNARGDYDYGIRAISPTYALGEGIKPISNTYNPVYEITFYIDGELVASYNSNEEFELPAIPPKEGYDQFPPVWSITDFSKITSDTRVDAIYHINEYEIKFYDKDGNVFTSLTLEHGATITAPELPEVAGYEFKGWNTEFSVATDDMEIRPIYEKLPDDNPPDDDPEVERKPLFSCDLFYHDSALAPLSMILYMYLRRKRKL